MDYFSFPSQKFDRRGRQVQDFGKLKWCDLSAALMSDEEDIGQNTFKIHRQVWRSTELDMFLDELDRRADGALKRAHPRKNRVLGMPLKIAAPVGIKDWMVKEDMSNSRSREGARQLSLILCVHYICMCHYCTIMSQYIQRRLVRLHFWCFVYVSYILL